MYIQYTVRYCLRRVAISYCPRSIDEILLRRRACPLHTKYHFVHANTLSSTQKRRRRKKPGFSSSCPHRIMLQQMKRSNTHNYALVSMFCMLCQRNEARCREERRGKDRKQVKYKENKGDRLKNVIPGAIPRPSRPGHEVKGIRKCSRFYRPPLNATSPSDTPRPRTPRSRPCSCCGGTTGT
jgi:hypothetical protein